MRSSSSSAPFEYPQEPREFGLYTFGVQLWDKQVEIVEAIRQHDAVACRSGHKCGKTCAVSVAAWLFCLTDCEDQSESRVVITAPTGHQVRRVVWREVRRMWARSDRANQIADRVIELGIAHLCTEDLEACTEEEATLLERLGMLRRGQLVPLWEAVSYRVRTGTRSDLPEPALDPGTGVRWADGREILGFSTDTPENMAGISSPRLLYIIDEASGVVEIIFEAIEGNLAGGARLLLISNPTKTSGQFFRAFTTERSEFYLIHVSSEDTPNAKTGERVVPGLAEKKWVEKRRRIWGKTDPRYQVRVAGNFPTQAENAVVSLGLIEAARQRYSDTEPGAILEYGVDVARFGDDDSCVVARRGLRAYKPRAVHGFNTTELAHLIIEMLTEPGPAQLSTERCVIRIDVGGGYGGGVLDALEALIAEHPDQRLRQLVQVIGINGSSTPADELQYVLKRDELWFGIREWFAEGGAIPSGCEQLEQDLLAPTYSFDGKSRVKVESKKDIKKRLGRSPDYGDAFGLCVDRSYSALAEVTAESLYSEGDDDSPDDPVRGWA